MLRKNYHDLNRPLENHINRPFEDHDDGAKIPTQNIIDIINRKIEIFVDGCIQSELSNENHLLQFLTTLMNTKGQSLIWKLNEKNIFYDIIPPLQFFKLLMTHPNDNRVHFETKNVKSGKPPVMSKEYHVQFNDDERGMPTWLTSKYYRSITYEKQYIEKKWKRFTSDNEKNELQKKLENEETEWRNTLLNPSSNDKDAELIKQKWIYFRLWKMNFIWDDVSGMLSFNLQIQVSPKWMNRPFQEDNNLLYSTNPITDITKFQRDFHPSVDVHYDIPIVHETPKGTKDELNQKKLEKTFVLYVYKTYYDNYFSLLPKQDQLKAISNQPYPQLYKDFYGNGSQDSLGLQFTPFGKTDGNKARDIVWVYALRYEKDTEYEYSNKSNYKRNIVLSTHKGDRGAIVELKLQFYYFEKNIKNYHRMFQMNVHFNIGYNYTFHIRESLDTLKYFPAKLNEIKKGTLVLSPPTPSSPLDKKPREVYQSYVFGNHSIAMTRTIPRLHCFYPDVKEWNTNMLIGHPNYTLLIDKKYKVEQSNMNDVFPFQSDNGSITWKKCIENPLCIQEAKKKLKLFESFVLSLGTTRFLWKDTDTELYAILYYGTSDESSNKKENERIFQDDCIYLSTMWHKIRYVYYMQKLIDLENKLTSSKDNHFGSYFHLEVYVMFMEIRKELRKTLKSRQIRRHIINKYFTWMNVGEVDSDLYLSGYYQSSLYTNVSNQDLFPLTDMGNTPPNMKDYNVGDDVRGHGSTYFLHWKRLSDQSNREIQKYNMNTRRNTDSYKGLYTLNVENTDHFMSETKGTLDNDESIRKYLKKLLDENGVHSTIPLNKMHEDGELELDTSSEYRREASVYTQTLELLYFIPQSSAIQNKYTGKLNNTSNIKYQSKNNRTESFEKILPDKVTVTLYDDSDTTNGKHDKTEDFNCLQSFFRILLSKKNMNVNFSYVFAIACTKHTDNKRQAKSNALPFYKPIQRQVCDEAIMKNIEYARETNTLTLDNDKIFDWIDEFVFEDSDFNSSEDNCIYIFHLLRLPLGDEMYGSEGLYFWKYLDFLPIFKMEKK